MLVPTGPSTESVIAPDRLARLSNAQIARYSRHLLLAEVGVEGQERIRASKVLLVGTGGLGSPLALYLAAAGVGTIGLVDFDTVDESNLQRQIIHTTRDVGRPKVASAGDSIRALNPDVDVVVHQTALTSENALSILADYDVIADGTDNFPTRYLVNDAGVLLGKPVVYGAILQFVGQASVFYAKRGPCYRCLHAEPPPPGSVPNCGVAGVLGVLPGIIGTIQATEALKLIIGDADPLIGRLLLLDAWTMRFDEVALAKDPRCPACGPDPTIDHLIDYDQFCGLKPDQPPNPVRSVSPTQLKARLDAGEGVQLLDVREPQEWAIAKLPGAVAIPLGQLERRIGELDPTRDTVAICRTGIRSALAIRTLEQAGYPGLLANLDGGLSAWAAQIDVDMPRY